MSRRLIFFLAVCVLSITQVTHAETDSIRSLLPNPINIIQWQLKTFINTIKDLVNKQLNVLNDIRKSVQTLVDNAIEATTKTIDIIIDGTVNRMRRIVQHAIDNGINATECLVLHLDKLNILRRDLIVNEIQCATSQVGEFYDILDGVAKNLTDNIFTIVDLPNRLQKCLITITPISCVTNIIEDLTELQKSIPKQIMGTMLEVSAYFNEFDQRVHKCQFTQLRKAIEGTREIVDSLYVCIHDKEMEVSQTTVSDDVIDTKTVLVNSN